MAMITCPECGAKISSETKTCPRCGAPMLTWKRGPVATFFHWAAITEVCAWFLCVGNLIYKQYFVWYPAEVAAGTATVSPGGVIFLCAALFVFTGMMNLIFAVPLFLMGSCHRVHRVTDVRVFDD